MKVLGKQLKILGTASNCGRSCWQYTLHPSRSCILFYFIGDLFFRSYGNTQQASVISWHGLPVGRCTLCNHGVFI